MDLPRSDIEHRLYNDVRRTSTDPQNGLNITPQMLRLNNSLAHNALSNALRGRFVDENAQNEAQRLLATFEIYNEAIVELDIQRTSLSFPGGDAAARADAVARAAEDFLTEGRDSLDEPIADLVANALTAERISRVAADITRASDDLDLSVLARDFGDFPHSGYAQALGAQIEARIEARLTELNERSEPNLRDIGNEQRPR